PVVEETRVMARHLDDHQTLSTAEAGALRLHRQMIEPRQMAEDAVAAYRSGADSAGVSLRLVGSSELPALEADPVRIGQVLANLLSNALRHTPPGGSVTVLVGLAGRSHDVQFTVQDSGPGIPP